MSGARIATDFFVKLHTRLAASEGVPITVLHKGYASSGAIVLKINLMNGFARVLIEASLGQERGWTAATATDPMPEKEADAYLTRQAEIDPDIWLIEIEDKLGRLWFPGKVADI